MQPQSLARTELLLMPMLDLQRRLTEVGRIRLGATDETNGKRRPKKLDAWRLTSADRARIEAAANIFGGDVEPWDRQWQVFTEATDLPILLIPGQELSQWYELWNTPQGGGAVSCLRRCDGVREIMADAPCMCPADGEERRELAAKGRACKPTTRLSVVLPDVQGLGSWRMETHGYYAAVELAGAADILRRATEQGVLLPARLRLDQREARRAGQVRRFPVPVIEVDVTPTEVLAIAGGNEQRPTLPAAASPQAALPPATEPKHPITDAQRRKLFKTATDAGMDEAALRAFLLQRNGTESTAAIDKADLDALLGDIKATASA